MERNKNLIKEPAARKFRIGLSIVMIPTSLFLAISNVENLSENQNDRFHLVSFIFWAVSFIAWLSILIFELRKK